MPYYHNPKTGDTGFVDSQGRQWELAPGGKGLPVQYRDFTEADLARTGGGHFGLLAGEVDPGLFAGGGVGNRPTLEGDPNASAYLVPRINGMNMLDYLQSKGRPTGVVAPQAAAPTGNAGNASSIVDAVLQNADAAAGAGAGAGAAPAPWRSFEGSGQSSSVAHPAGLDFRKKIAARQAPRVTPLLKSLVGSGAGGETQRILGLGGF